MISRALDEAQQFLRNSQESEATRTHSVNCRLLVFQVKLGSMKSAIAGRFTLFTSALAQLGQGAP